MIKNKFHLLVALFIMSATTAFAGYALANVQAAFTEMYPAANDVAWSQDDG